MCNKFFTSDVSAKGLLIDSFWKVMRLGLMLLGRKVPNRFLILTPTGLTRQIIYDRKRNIFIKVYIRDFIDYCTLCQIYNSEDYGLEKMSRGTELVDAYKKLLTISKTPLIIDCGSNIGLSSKYFLDEFPDAKIICIEPDYSNSEMARKNLISENSVHMIAAIGSTKGWGSLVDPGLGNNALRIESSLDVTDIQIVSVDSLLARYCLPNFSPFIIKIDIEGFESILFSDNTEWIEKFPLIIIELHDWMLPGQANSLSFLRAISRYDRDFVFFGENVFSIRNA